MVTFSSVAQSISLTWIYMMARFEAENFLFVVKFSGYEVRLLFL